MLFRQLDKRGVVHDRVNVWEDEDAAAFVRAAANGNETVPTVAVGRVVLVNPDVRTVLRHAAEHAPESVLATYESPRPGRFRGWLTGG